MGFRVGAKNFFKKNLNNKNNNKNTAGFTLLEVLSTLAIVGILASLVIPCLGIYLDRAKVSEGLNLIGPVKLAITQYVLEHDGLSGADSNQQVGLPEKIAGNFVESVWVSQGGLITVKYSQPAGTIIWTPNYNAEQNRLVWDCTTGSLPQDVRPSQCKKNNKK